MSEYMIGKACIDCGEADPVCLDFDHRDGSDTKFKIGDALHFRVGLGSCRPNWGSATCGVVIVIANATDRTANGNTPAEIVDFYNSRSRH